ncbi:beta-lactamase [Dactylonectria estremocensis]|uniref:Beta-lactamase n=1 Tax=Dactylonectria estremocensis TaxID=1079267 RepID=A0A9P9IH13_9HYPO|nr:beta-lactamase [Dactylonectria estremocensis]
MEAYEALLEKSVRERVVPGVISLAKDTKGKLDYSKVISGPDSTYALDTVLEVASLTKLITTIAALQLVERGLITLDEDVALHIPAFASRDVLDGEIGADGTYSSHKRKNRITLHHLLTHTAGTSYTFTDQRIAKYVSSSPAYETKGTIDTHFHFPLSYEPGEGWLYGNALDRVGQIIEKLSGDNLEDYFQKNIFRPLGISSASFWSDTRPPMAVRAHQHAPAILNPDAESFTTGLNECFGGQGLFINLQDYIKVLYSLLVDDEVLLKQETTALMFQPQLSPVTKAALLQTLESPGWAVGDLPPTGEYDWGYGGLLIDGDHHSYRRRNTLLWSGAPSLFWFIDREADLCGVFGTQVLPPSDPSVRPIIKAFEEAVYHQLDGVDNE